MIRIDARNTIGPLAILEIGAHLERAAPGERLEVLCDDEAVLRDVRRIHPECEWSLETSRNGAGCAFVLRKPETAATQAATTTQPEPQPEPRSTAMSELDLSSIQPSSTADARGSACPGPLLEAKKGIGKVKVGEILEVYSNDSGTRTDIPAWAAKVGHEYLGLLPQDGYDKHFIRRKK
ncbi:MAG: sulfurtransferase TusA family protein [Desulfovibrionaceae bacterium]|nr:sulfurtransferase TusA family protein [Desulfovibrionaceae bacterium]